jgi:type III secretory pathway component EscS
MGIVDLSVVSRARLSCETPSDNPWAAYANIGCIVFVLEPSMADSIWVQRAKERRGKLRALFERGVRQDIFNEKYFEALYQRKMAIKQSEAKAGIIQRTILVFLLLALLFPSFQISMMGVSGKASDLREILVLIASTMQFVGIFELNETTAINDILEAYATVISKGDAEVLAAVRVRFSLGGRHLITVPKYGEVRARSLALLFVSSTGLILWALIAVFGLFFVQAWTLISILRDPSVSRFVSILIVLYVLSVDMWWYGTQIMSRPTILDDDETVPKLSS